MLNVKNKFRLCHLVWKQSKWANWNTKCMTDLINYMQKRNGWINSIFFFFFFFFFLNLGFNVFGSFFFFFFKSSYFRAGDQRSWFMFFLFFSSSHFQSLTSFAVWLSLPIVPNKFRQVVKIKFVKRLSVWALVVMCSSFYSIISASMPILKALPAEKRECTRRCVWSEQILLLKLEIVKKTNGLLSCLNVQ